MTEGCNNLDLNTREERIQSEDRHAQVNSSQSRKLGQQGNDSDIYGINIFNLMNETSNT